MPARHLVDMQEVAEMTRRLDSNLTFNLYAPGQMSYLSVVEPHSIRMPWPLIGWLAAYVGLLGVGVLAWLWA